MAPTVILRQLEEHATASILAAFASTEVPDPADVRNDHCPECRETAETFSGEPWDAITMEKLVASRPSPCLLTAAAFRYYLPALMLRCIEAPVVLDVLPDELIGTLSPAGGNPDGASAERWREFTASQVAAILAFLRVFEMRQRMESGASEDLLDVARVTKPLARAIRYWTSREAPVAG
ncbi:MAG TPA: DUF6714 family protein [Polyangiaceae bacterium]|jgi:hypothetical protein